MTISDFTTFSNREVIEGVFKDYATGKPFLNCDFANVTTTEITGESVFAYGGQGHPKRVAFTGERGGTISIETQIQTPQLYSLITGAELEDRASLAHREVVTCQTENILIVKQNPVIGSIFVFKADDDCGSEIKGTYTAASQSGTGYSVTLSEAVGSGKLETGTKYVIYYEAETTQGVKNIPIKSTTFPKAFSFSGIAPVKTEDDAILDYYLKAYKLVPQSNFSVSFSNTGDPASITITCDLLVDSEGRMLDMAIMEQ